jgi:hypothetical protein
MPVASPPSEDAPALPVDRHRGYVSAAALSRRPGADMGRRIGAGAQLGIEAIGWPSVRTGVAALDWACDRGQVGARGSCREGVRNCGVHELTPLRSFFLVWT